MVFNDYRNDMTRACQNHEKGISLRMGGDGKAVRNNEKDKIAS